MPSARGIPYRDHPASLARQVSEGFALGEGLALPNTAICVRSVPSWSSWQAQCDHFGVATDRLRRLAAAIRRRRLELRLTQEHVAYESGTSVRNYARIEAGTVNVRSLTLYEIATVLKTTPARLFDAADEGSRRRKA